MAKSKAITKATLRGSKQETKQLKVKARSLKIAKVPMKSKN